MTIELETALAYINTLLHGSLITICVSWVVRLVNETKQQKNTVTQLRWLVCMYLSWLAFGYCYDLAWVYFSDAIHDSILAKIILLQLDSLVFPLTTFLMTNLTRRKKITCGLVMTHILPFILIPPIGVLFHWEWFYPTLILAIGIYCLASISIHAISANRYRHYITEEYADLQGRDIHWINQFFVLYAIQVILWIVAMWWSQMDVLQIIYYIICIFVICLLASNLKRMIHACEHNLDETEMTDLKNLAEEKAEEQNKNLEQVSQQESLFLQKLQKECVEAKLYTHPDITRDELSRAMGINHTYFTRMLHESTGMNFNEYINDLRVVYAEHMLADISIPLNAIPSIAGFNSKATYYAVFTKKYGCTPKVYREQMITS